MFGLGQKHCSHQNFSQAKPRALYNSETAWKIHIALHYQCTSLTVKELIAHGDLVDIENFSRNNRSRPPLGGHLQVGHDIARVVVGDGGGPAGANPLSAVDEGHGDDGQVRLGLDLLAVVVQVRELGVVAFGEDDARHGGEPREDVARAGMVLAACARTNALKAASSDGTRRRSAARIIQETELFQLHLPVHVVKRFQSRRRGCQPEHCARTPGSRCGCSAPRMRVPNWPEGISTLTLLEPTKSWASPTMVLMSDASPWWYAECSAT